MAIVGRALLVLALLVCVYGIAASLYGARAGQQRFVDSGRRAVYALAAVAAIAFAILEGAFLGNNFSYNVVAQASSTTTPTLYKFAAVWSTQQGSLLLWILLLSFWSSLVLFLARRRAREIAPYATAVLLGFGLFFTTLATFFANPFATTANAPSEGAGLDPLLRHTTMMMHPPMLYSGYTMLTIPFAFGVAALVTGRTGAEWIALTRRFALAAWLCLGVGIMLGARWSYVELGWGGYWAWDPVENAALIPWLLSTAFLHSIMIQEKRGMLRVWNASLILATGCSAIVGTFLVRSGILSSIHAFVSDPTLNISFVVLIGIIIAGSIGLVLWRRPLLRSEARLDSLISREAVFLFQNMVLVALAFAIFWLTFFPLISKAITGTQLSVGPPTFQPFVVPLTLLVVLLAGVGPVLAWRRVTVAGLRRSFTFPLGVGAIALLILLATLGTVHLLAVALFACASFVLAVVVQEFWRGARARHAMAGESPPVAVLALVRRNRRRYGGYIVHAGLAVLLVGVAASTSFKQSRYATLRPGQSAAIGGYTVKYLRPTVAASNQKLSLGAVLRVSKGSQQVARVRTAYEMFPAQDPSLGPIGRFFDGSTESQIGLHSGFMRDVWTDVDPCAGRVSSCLGPLQPAINRANAQMERLLRAIGRMPAAEQQRLLAPNSQVWTARDERVLKILSLYVSHPWPVTFLMIVSPLVMWLWLGGLIMVAGALIALRPSMPRLSRVRVRAREHAPSARRGQGVPVREPA